MHVLIVYAHPEPKSFNGALRDRAVAVLGFFKYQAEQLHVVETGVFAALTSGQRAITSHRERRR